jgi:hypothetical protein
MSVLSTRIAASICPFLTVILEQHLRFLDQKLDNIAHLVEFTPEMSDFLAFSEQAAL